MDCQRYAIDSVERYLEFLRKNNKGLVENTIRRIEKDGKVFLLYLEGRVSHFDYSFVRINDLDYYEEDICFGEVDEGLR